MVTEPNVTIVRAPNPSLMTLDGTNSYLVHMGNGEAICIDPGPAIESHVEALLEAAEDRQWRIATIAVTHNHPDHWPAAPLLADATGAPIAMHASSSAFHDIALNTGDEVHGLEVMYAPGHTFDHIVFYDVREHALFTGDVILGKGTVAIAPPGGSMRDYQRTLHALRETFPHAARIYGGHRPVVFDPQEKIQEYITHRENRERELLDVLADGPQTIPQLVQRIYSEIDRGLLPAAARQLLAYLLPLEQEGRVHSRALKRTISPDETAILNPNWERLVGRENAPLVEAELGSILRLDSVREYALS